MATQPNILKFSPNRVRRNYRGGYNLDKIEGVPNPKDGECPEDWIASTTPAVNPGLTAISREGISQVTIPESGIVYLKDLFSEHAEHYLGKRHLVNRGVEMGFLTKFLDGSMRLHVQAHPTAAFAQKFLNSPYGKLETYVILGWRDGIEPYIRLGFQNPPSPEEWRRIVLEQDIKAMDACFEKIPVEKGQVWYVPGGLPHALGEGLLVLEVMEPSDLVVRCEFEREGIIVPPAARFMNRDPDFALQIFDHSPYPLEKVIQKCKVTPKIVANTPQFQRELLIGPDHTSCFRQERWSFAAGTHSVEKNEEPALVIVTEGRASLRSGHQEMEVNKFDRFLIAANAEPTSIICAPNSGLACIFIFPGPGE